MTVIGYESVDQHGGRRALRSASSTMPFTSAVSRTRCNRGFNVLACAAFKERTFRSSSTHAIDIQASTIFLQSRRRADVVDHDGKWKMPLRLSSQGAFPRQNTFAYSAASFSFFSGRTLRRTEAGFAANHLSSPVNGSLPKRFFLAGTSCATTFSKPGSVNSFAPFL